MDTNNLETFYKRTQKFADLIESSKQKLYSILAEYETHGTAADEIIRSITTLRGFREEFSSISDPLHNLNFSTFFPLNLPLYSLVLFGIAPSAFASNVFIRPPEVMHDILSKLWKELSVESFFPELSLQPTPRHIFMELYASESDVIIFTGKYENALAIHEACPESMLIYNGSGVNPFLLFQNANIELAAKKAVEMRCFNSGQDCAGPDAFFVPSSLADIFIQQLQTELKAVKVGPPSDSSNSIGYTIKTSYIDELKGWINKHKDEVYLKGAINEDEHLVHPTIVRRKLELNDSEEFHEFFAPFFYVLEYENLEVLNTLLHSKPFVDRAMYISVFGENKEIEKNLDFVKLLRNKIVNDVEIGNDEYGGYGPHANFILYKGQKYDHPVLISRDLHQIMKRSLAQKN